MLEIDRLDAGYGPLQVLFEVSFRAAPGEITCLTGLNGAGKTTVLRAITGLIPAMRGDIYLEGKPLLRVPASRRVRSGIGYVPQGRRLFAELTVLENLEIGLRNVAPDRGPLEKVLGYFPRLRERLGQEAGTLSGGEQQMLAMARALCTRPKLLLLDEPTEGLQPSMIALIQDVTRQLKGEGVAILLVEQRLDAVRSLADRVVVLETGRVVEVLARPDLAAQAERLKLHLGV